MRNHFLTKGETKMPWVLLRLELARVWNCTIWDVDEAGEDEIGRQIEVWALQKRYTLPEGT